MGDYIPNAPLTDEDKKHNQNLPGMGGVFNPVNFALYHFAGNNPIRYTDPDGKQDDKYVRSDADYDAKVKWASEVHPMDPEKNLEDGGLFDLLFLYKGTAKAYLELNIEKGISRAELKAIAKSYAEVGGHHIPAKSAFTNAKNYNWKEVLTIPELVLERMGIDHGLVSGAQQTGYRQLLKSGVKIPSWDQMQKVEIAALIKGGANKAQAEDIVKFMIDELKKIGVTGATRMPWGP